MIGVQELRLAVHGGHGAAPLQAIQKQSGRKGLRKLIAEAEDDPAGDDKPQASLIETMLPLIAAAN